MFAICPLSVVPVRKEPSDRSELVTQLLFGDLVEIQDRQDNWRKIKVLDDDYPGWVDKKQLRAIEEAEVRQILGAPRTVTLDIVQLVVWDQHQMIPVVLGSTLPAFRDKHFTISGTEFQFEGSVTMLSKPDPARMLEHAYMYLHAPYLWGGKSPFGIDCSGFTQMVYKLSGIRIRRDAAQQAEQGTPVPTIDAAQAGDLAFFVNDEGRVVHTGILLPGGRIMHASGRVRIDTLDPNGILNADSGQYTHRLHSIRRYAANGARGESHQGG